MERETGYPFFELDADKLAEQLTELFERITGAPADAGSKVRLFLSWMASALLLLMAQANWAANQNIPRFASGKNLDELAELFHDVRRPPAKAAGCRVRFSISEPQEFAVLIPKGTRVTDENNTLMWETAEESCVNPGETFADVEAVCQSTGTVGNGFAPGRIHAIVDPFPYFQSCENVTESGGGADEAADGELYELMRLSMDTYSCAGAQGAYVYYAKRVSAEIADVAVNSPEPCVVKLYILMKDGTIANEEVKGKALAACSPASVRPLCDFVSVEDPEVVEYDIDLTWYMPREGKKSGARTEQDVAAAVQSYIEWQRGKLGRDINPSRLIAMLMESGVKRVELRSPGFVPLRDGAPGLTGAGELVPQAARARLVNCVNGGYEDE